MLALLERLLKLDMKKWLQLIDDMDLAPTMFGTLLTSRASPSPIACPADGHGG